MRIAPMDGPRHAAHARWTVPRAAAPSGDARAGVGLRVDLPRDRYDLRAGAQLQLGERWRAWGDLGVARAADGFRDVSAQLGLTYRF